MLTKKLYGLYYNTNTKNKYSNKLNGRHFSILNVINT